MASFVVLKIATENEEYPDVAVILRRDCYMDDLIHSCPTPQEAVNRMIALDKVLAKRRFEINKWYCSSNSAKPEMQANSLAKPATPEVEKPKFSQNMASPIETWSASDRNQLRWRERADQDSRSRLESSNRYSEFHSEQFSIKRKVH